jgi:glycerol uptake facilitator-like aquaporin
MAESFDGSSWIRGLISESVIAFTFVSTLLIAPEFLEVNKLSRYFVSLLVMPLMMLPACCHSSSFNPAALYALWYVNGTSNTLHMDHFIGSLIGAIGAGYLALLYFPDDQSSWIRRSSIL